MKKTALFLAALGTLLTVPDPAWCGLKDVKDCSATREEDIEAAAGAVARNWKDFESFVEDATGMNIKNCMENRFKKNGKVVCESSRTGKCSNAAAWASPLNRKVHLCPGLYDDVDTMDRKPDRRACYAAVMAHEFAHTCERFEAGSDRIDEAAFDWYDSTHELTIDKRDCGID